MAFYTEKLMTPRVQLLFIIDDRISFIGFCEICILNCEYCTIGLQNHLEAAWSFTFRNLLSKFIFEKRNQKFEAQKTNSI